MFSSSKKKKKSKEKGSGFDPPTPTTTTTKPPRVKPAKDNVVYQTVDEVGIKPTSEIIHGNVSDDFKIDSLKKNSSPVVDKSGIPPPAPPLPSPAGPPAAPPLPPPAVSPAAPPPPPAPQQPAASEPAPKRPPREPEMTTLDKNRNYALFSTTPRDDGNRKAPSRRRDSPARPKIDKAAFDNPVFMRVDGPVPQGDMVTYPRALKEQQSQFPGLAKKVSWNTAVVYNSEAKTDIVIAGVPEDDSETDEPPTPTPARKTGFDSYRNLSTIPEHNKLSYDDISATRLAASDDEDGSEMETRRSRMFTDRRDLGRDGDSAPQTTTSSGQSSGTKRDPGDYKCSLCVAVVLVAICVVALAVLGTLYGVRLTSAPTPAEQLAALTSTFSLRPVPAGGVFLRAQYRVSDFPAADGAAYVLLESGSIMPWQSPERPTALTWLRGAPLKAYIVDRANRLTTKVLGDPVRVTGAQYTLSLENTDWYAVNLLEGGPEQYAFVSLNNNGVTYGWVDANVTRLVLQLGLSDQTLLEEVRRYSRDSP